MINIRLEDIDSKRKLIIIRQAKGRKDLNRLLYKKTSSIFTGIAYKLYTPEEYLFTGQNGGKYSPRSVQKLVKKADQRAGIKKHVTTHTLRHSFATYLLE